MSNVQALRARFETLAAREKLMVVAAGGLVALALVWWIAFAPAVSVLRQAEAQHRALDAQQQHMLRLQAQARTMQAQPRQSHDEALRLLELSIRQHLGVTARYAIAGDRVTITLTGTSPASLAQWLTQARVNARALPGEARLTRNAGGMWEGTIVLTLPPRS